MEIRGFVRKLWKIPVDIQRERLIADGVKIIYEAGKGAEDVDSCINAFRGRGGIIKIAADLRVFGDTQDEITEAVSKCEEASVRIIDLAHPELKTVSKQQRYAFGRIAFMRRWDGDKRKAGRTGSEGGKAKAIVAAAKRAERVPDDTICRLIGVVEARKVLTWRYLEWALGGKPFSVGTLRRHYDGVPPPEPKIRKGRKR